MEKTQPVPSAAPLGMFVFLASLAVLFAASLVAFYIVRSGAADWPPPGMPALPHGLWISTLILLVSSATMHTAQWGARTGRAAPLRRGLLLTTLLGLAFLVAQVVVWRELVGAQLTAGTNLYGFTFYVLTALHGLHVIGGLIPLTVTTVRAHRGRYTPRSYMGVKLCAMYWHFLDLVWVVIFSFLVVFA